MPNVYICVYSAIHKAAGLKAHGRSYDFAWYNS